MTRIRVPEAQLIERRPPEPGGVCIALAERDAERNGWGLTLWSKCDTGARYHEDLHRRSARANLPGRGPSRWVSTWTGSWQR